MEAQKEGSVPSRNTRHVLEEDEGSGSTAQQEGTSGSHGISWKFIGQDRKKINRRLRQTEPVHVCEEDSWYNASGMAIAHHGEV